MANCIAHFDIPYTQILGPDGTLKQHSHIKDNKALLTHLYETMRLVRTFDKKAIALQRTGKMGTYAPIHGQEAISTVIGKAMHETDVLIPYYRDYGAQILRGVKMAEILAFWGGDERGSQYAHQSQDLPICVPIASQCLHAAGVAFAFKYRQEKRAAVVTLGEGGTSEGDFYEAINVAGCWKLPVVFIVNNNQWAISVPRHKQTATETIAQKAIAAGFAGIQVDGNDALGLYEVITQALDKARSGEGPTLIEAITYRLSDHTTADDATRYQPQVEVSEAKPNEPIKRLRQYLEHMQMWDSTAETALEERCNTLVNDAVEEYLSAQRQPASSIFDFHYETLPDYLVVQRAQAMEEDAHG